MTTPLTLTWQVGFLVRGESRGMLLKNGEARNANGSRSRDRGTRPSRNPLPGGAGNGLEAVSESRCTFTLRSVTAMLGFTTTYTTRRRPEERKSRCIVRIFLPTLLTALSRYTILFLPSICEVVYTETKERDFHNTPV